VTEQAAPELKYDNAGLIPAVVQDFKTGAVLMVAWMNQDSLKRTMKSGYTHFWSRSRKKLWKKGETSGHVQRVREIRADCDRDTLLIQVEQTGPACHTESYTCFFDLLQENDGEERARPEILEALYSLILDRKSRSPEGSYVASLVAEGGEKIAAKVVEEAGEVAAASKDESAAELVSELADLWFHALVLLGWHDLSPSEVFRELSRRFGKPGGRAESEKD
jgi:phosphoribosyl-ATP pyrophosphohydrolase/phosphoribosyl-AMP cyclohydrolase